MSETVFIYTQMECQILSLLVNAQTKYKPLSCFSHTFPKIHSVR